MLGAMAAKACCSNALDLRFELEIMKNLTVHISPCPSVGPSRCRVTTQRARPSDVPALVES